MGRKRKISGLEASHIENKEVGKTNDMEETHVSDTQTVNICGSEDREELLRKLRCKIRQEMEQSSVNSKTNTGIVRRTSTEINPDTAQDNLSDLLWNVLSQYQKEPFYTVKGLEFTYYIKGNELFVSRKDKSITRASVDVALKKAMEQNLVVSGPKKLTSFGASYLYPIFLKLGIITPAAAASSSPQRR